MQCDHHCSEYSPCLSSSCPIETCDNLVAHQPQSLICQTDTCVEGCQLKPCPAGHIYRNDSYTECVPRSVCQPICKIEAGITYYEGDILSSDACHTCRCNRGQTICSGIPCTTQLPVTITTTTTTTARPYLDAGHKCSTGWTSWINQDRLDAAKVKDIMKFGDIEPLPDAMLLNGINSPAVCGSENMTKIECRCAVTQQAPKETSEDVECSLERGLFAMGLVHDYEIRLYCECSDDYRPAGIATTLRPAYDPASIPNFNEHLIDISKPCDPNTPNIDFPGDCSKFLQCERSIDVWLFVEKPCAPGTLYNPKSMICDWPAEVMKIKPECGITKKHTPKPTPAGPTENINAQPICPPDQKWNSEVVLCNATCHYYRAQLHAAELCHGKYDTFQLGCMTATAGKPACGGEKVWRDDKVCTTKAHCTCMSKSGTMVKVGQVGAYLVASF